MGKFEDYIREREKLKGKLVGIGIVIFIILLGIDRIIPRLPFPIIILYIVFAIWYHNKKTGDKPDFIKLEKKLHFICHWFSILPYKKRLEIYEKYK